jgi:site-specific recombinase XerC
MHATELPIRNIGRGKKPWMLDLRYVGGKRTCYRSKSEAEGVREEKLIELRNFGTSVAALTDADRAEFIAAKRRLAPLGVTITQAVDYYVSNFKPRKSQTLGVALDQMLSEKAQAKRRQRYVRQIGYDVRGFVADKLDEDCRTVTSQQVHDWLHGNGWEPKTIEGKFINLQTYFSFALSKGWLEENPCAAVARVSVDYKKPGILTVEQCEKLMRAAESHPTEKRLVPYLALALFAGVRPEEIHRLSWGAINDGVIWLESEVSKVRHHRVVKLSENCKAWLALGGDLPPVNWEDGLQIVRQSAGFEYSDRSKVRGKKSVRHKGAPWSHNCLRHSFVSYSLPIHGVAETARHAGNSEQKVHSNYKALVNEDQAKAFWRIMPCATDANGIRSDK